MNKKVSIVLPVFNEKDNIFPIYNSIVSLIKEKYNYEIIFVDDGSKDGTDIILEKLSNIDKNVKVIIFTRNFGHQNALIAGIEKSTGDCIITMDADFQDPPELILNLLQEWENGYKIVYTRRTFRNDSFFKKFTANIFYSLQYFASEIKIKGEIGDFRLIDRFVANQLLQLKERNKYLRGIIPWFGYDYKIINYIRPKRKFGKTKFNFIRMARFAMTGILSFSLLPIRIGLFIGIITFFIGVSLLLHQIITFLFNSQASDMYYFLYILNFTLIGLLFIFLWIIAEYIGKIYDEVRERPLYVIKKTINFDENINA